MIEFQNIECDPTINKKEFSSWLNEILIEENKMLGDIVYIPLPLETVLYYIGY